jgi:RNase P subunit RPR2
MNQQKTNDEGKQQTLISSKPNTKAQNFQNVLERQGGYGRLKFVSKTRNSFICRECKTEVAPGSKCYMQSDYTGEGTFPVQTRLCMACAQIQIDKGVGIKEGRGTERSLK